MRPLLPFIAALGLAACGPQADGSPNTGGASNTDEPWVSDGSCEVLNEGCGPGSCRDAPESATMLPGSDCLACHSPGGMDDEIFSVGGTVFVDQLGSAPTQGAVVRVIDADGRMVEMSSNRAGNFYSERSLTPPLTAEVEVDGRVIPMATEVSTGACNTCHACEGETGKLYAR